MGVSRHRHPSTSTISFFFRLMVEVGGFFFSYSNGVGEPRRLAEHPFTCANTY
jgi:hypothetical protein